MASESPYLRAILPTLPADIAKKIRILCGSPQSSAEYVLETLIRFISGAECASDSPDEARLQWDEKQQAAAKVLNDMTRRPSAEPKRQRDDDMESEAQAPKRHKTSMAEDSPTPDEEVFTLHSVSATSPVRKKVDITICKASLKITHSATHVVEATVPLSSLTRAFLLPTRGKLKPHWTVVLLSTDAAERAKPVASSAQPSPQVIFGLDAIASAPLTTTTYGANSEGNTKTLSKGSPTASSIRDFLSHLKIQALEPTPNVFKSVCTGVGSGVSANEDGVPGIEAYRGAKPGSLWFMEEGILWGESKPCEFWAVEDLIGKAEGLRVVNASGRTCSIILTRKSEAEEDVGDDGEDMGVETEFSLVDAREKSGIDAWVRAYRHLFGKKKMVGAPVTITQVEDDSDEEDEDFEMDSDEAGDTSSTSSESSDEENGGHGSDGDAPESDADGSSDDDEEDALREEDHPLMRPGAMPRMSRSMVDMVVGMVQEDLVGNPQSEEDDLEEDELDD